MNPMALLKLKDKGKAFASRHPKAVAFAKKEFLSDLPEGTVLELTVTKPGQSPVTANIKLTGEDAALAADIKSAFGKK